MTWTRLMAAISAGLMVATGGVQAVAAPRTADARTAARTTEPQREHSATVRLITGDRVTVTQLPGGRRTASVVPGPGREHIVFQTLEQDDKSLTVLPSDAETMVAAGSLDRRLFDVTGLIAQGYTEARGSVLPLIVHDKPSANGARVTAQQAKASSATAHRLMALKAEKTAVRDLGSIDARSLRIEDEDLGAFWKTLNPGAASGIARVAVTPRISLDGKVKAVLDRSTAQINAPTAWKAGYEGQGVEVAVLDTGIDAGHPDLAGSIAETKNFSDSPDTVDRFGHGTHVASIVGGTGAASSGLYRGVAPKSRLLVGKVLDDEGVGSESQVIDGMEWAAGSGAKVINMSLGSSDRSDGTDAMSLALNALTASTGALFVVAAGNDGSSRMTVGTPGVADAALTVGSVSRTDTVSAFSSVGPRQGDGAVKPDVTAPGEVITAARAQNSILGDPVDARYTRMSGTSMATPHVAGAAALLAQQHPDWDAKQLKDALVSTAHVAAGNTPPQQGGGRIDLGAAMGPLTATGTVTLPRLRTDAAGGPKDAANLQYTNKGDKPLTLALDLSLRTEGGLPVPDGVVSLGSRSVEVAPGATVTVPVRTDASNAVRGKFYGYVTAASAEGTVLAHTTVSLAVNLRQHRLTVVSRDRDGKVLPDALPFIWGPDGFGVYTDRQSHTALLDEGVYYLSSSDTYTGEDGDEVRQVVLPQVDLTKDTTVTLDASKVTEVKIRTPRPAEQRGVLSTYFHRALEGAGLTQGFMYFDVVNRLLVSPTAPVTSGEFEFSTRQQMVAPQLRAEVPRVALPLVPYYEPFSPLFGDGGARLTAVDAGTSAAPDFRKARGKLAIVQYDTGDDVASLAGAAKAAGAQALLLSWFGGNGMPAWTRWQPQGERLALPTIRVHSAQGKVLLARARKAATTVEFSGTARSPYLYDVMASWKKAVPQSLLHTVSEKESAVVHADYTRTGATTWGSEQRFGWRPYQDTAWNQYSRYVPLGQQRVEYVTAGDTLWSHVVHHNVVAMPDSELKAGLRNSVRTYRPGEQATEKWFGAVVRPSIPRGAPWESAREGDTLSVRVPEFTDSFAGNWSFAEQGFLIGGGDVATAALYRDGEQIAESGQGAWGDFQVPAGDAEYRLDLSTSRTSDDWSTGTGTRTSWTFRSAAASGKALLPLLQIDYDVRADLRNALGPERGHSIGLNVRMQDGMSAPRGVTLRVDASYDGGRTWMTAPTAHKGSGFTALVNRPWTAHGDAYVTLRVTATDTAGNSVRQTVDRAYLHRGGKGFGRPGKR